MIMSIAGFRIRSAVAGDAAACAATAYAAHARVSAVHNFPSELPTLEVATRFIRSKLENPRCRGYVAEKDGYVVGSVFVTAVADCPAGAIGPLTVEPAHEGGVGAALLQEAVAEAARMGIVQLRLIQSPTHLRSLALYTKAGFDLREPLLVVTNTALTHAVDNSGLRRATLGDDSDCACLCRKVYGFARTAELNEAIGGNTAMVLERKDRIAGYACSIGFRGHAVASTVEDLMVLIAHAPKSVGAGLFIPTRNGALLRWLLHNGARALWPAAIFSIGDFHEPTTPYLPSMVF
jgi:predicted N-acetyltransferase YhbS